jgi:hypothetical protein
VKQRGKLLSFQKLHFGRSGAFDRNQRDLVTGLNHLRHSLGEVLEESTERCQPLIPGPNVIVPVGFQMNQEKLCALEREVLDRELCNPLPKILCGKTQKETQSVSITSNRCRLESFLDFEMVFKERMQNLSQSYRHCENPS